MTKFINYIIGFILLIMCIMNIVLVKDLEEKTVDLIELSNSKSEVIVLDSLVYDTVFIERTEIVKLPIVNTLVRTDTLTLIEIDSVDVAIPIELKQFNDTLGETAISFDLRGFQCKVDNLYLKSMKVPTIEQNKPKRWGIGVQLGVGGCKDGFSPYFGVGLSYDLVQF